MPTLAVQSAIHIWGYSHCSCRVLSLELPFQPERRGALLSEQLL